MNIQSDWHRYNLKRKVIQLPPVSEAHFLSVASAASSSSLSCSACQASFASQKLLSKHKCPAKAPTQELSFVQKIAAAQSEDEIQALIDEKIATAPRLDPEADCLFCNQKSGSLSENLEHMSTKHSFFLPDQDYLSDTLGLIDYLGAKISVSNICIHCNGTGKTFYSLNAVRKHMLEKGHTKIAWGEGDEDEYLEFYDYASGLPDDDEDAWIDEEETSGQHDAANDDDETSHHDSVSTTPATRRSDLAPLLRETDLGLLLPSGQVAGHRAFKKIWNQTLSTGPTSRGLAAATRAVVSRRAGTSALLLREQKHAGALQRQRQGRDFMRAQKDLRARVGQKANGLQRYYREQNPL